MTTSMAQAHKAAQSSTKEERAKSPSTDIKEDT